MKMSPSSPTRFQKSSGSRASTASSKRTSADIAPSLAARFPETTLVPVEVSEDLSDYSYFDDGASDTTDLTVDDDRRRDSCAPATPRTPRSPLTPPTTGRSTEKFKPSSPCITSRAAGKTPVDAIEASSKPRVSSSRTSTALHNSNRCQSKETGSSSFSYSGSVTKFGKDLEFIIPYEISARLSEDQTKCIATLVKSKDGVTRCSCNAKGSPCGYPIQHRLQALKKACSERNYTTLVDCIKEFSSIVMCGKHYKVEESPRVEKLKKFVSTLQAGNASKKEVKDFHAWLKQLSNATYNTSTSTVDESSHERHCDGSDSTPRSTDSAASEFSGETGASVQNNTKVSTTATRIQFQPYQPKTTKNISTSEALRRVLERELTKTDLKRGFIYLLRNAGQYGHIKIGRSKNIVERLWEWNRDCQRKHELCKPSFDGELDEVPHVNRIEKLMEAELKDLRRSTECGRCQKLHREWFEVEEIHAVAVFKKWKQWIETSPYERCADGKWRLSESARKGLDKVCQPVFFAGNVANEPKKKKKKNGQYKRAS